MNNLTSQQKMAISVFGIVLLIFGGIVNLALVRGSIMFWVNWVLMFGGIALILSKMWRGFN